MIEPELKRLVDALDTVVTWAAGTAPEALSSDIELAQLRLRCLQRRLGHAVQASPYLDFLARVGAQARPTGGALAAGA